MKKIYRSRAVANAIRSRGFGRARRASMNPKMQSDQANSAILWLRHVNCNHAVDIKLRASFSSVLKALGILISGAVVEVVGKWFLR